MRNPPGAASRRHLPQECQIERPYSDAEWVRFLECARDGLQSGEGLDNEFTVKIVGHDVSEAQVRRALRPRAKLASYLDQGRGRVALWDGEETGLLILARETNGLIFNAYRIDDFDRVLCARENVRRLRR